jgi:DNA-binding MarR family transcriptional regulator
MEQSQSEPSVSSTPSAEGLVAWRAFLTSAWALTDILDAELAAEQGLSLRWYDLLVHLEDEDEGLPMNELASRILSSKSGLTSVVDRMERAGLVARERPASDRRVVRVLLTPAGRDTLHAARVIHRRGIEEHFLGQLGPRDVQAVQRIFDKVRDHVRPLRPGRVGR